MLDIGYGTRLNKFDYEELGRAKRWYFRNTIILLTSLEMEIEGYYDIAELDEIYSRVYHKYNDYMWDCIVKEVIAHDNALTADYVVPDRPDTAQKDARSVTLDFDRSNFNKDDLLKYILENNEMNIDISTLSKYLIGEDVPVFINNIRNRVVAGKLKNQSVNTSQAKPKTQNNNMLELAKIRHKASNEAKDRIRRFVEEEMKPPCTCLNSQMKRYVIRLAKADGSGISLKYKSRDGVKTISDNVLKSVVNTAMGKVRTQMVNVVLQECPKHGLNGP